nr:polysaccharide deacetylase [uncultured bacterium]
MLRGEGSDTRRSPQPQDAPGSTTCGLGRAPPHTNGAREYQRQERAGEVIAARPVYPLVEGRERMTRSARREVSVTFDDLPMQPPLCDGPALAEVTGKLLAALVAEGVSAVGFVNESALYAGGELDAARVNLLRAWLDAGMELGNHTFSHLDLHRTPGDEFEADIARGEIVTRELLEARGAALEYFRHPYLHTGLSREAKEGVERFLRGRGMAVAPVTVQSEEWMFAQAYDKAKMNCDGAAMREVAAAFLPYMEESFDYFEKLSARLLGREIRQVLLLHASALHADHFPALAALMRGRGYAFVTLGRALDDPAYAHADDCITPDGLSWLRRWAATDGVATGPQPAVAPRVNSLWEDLMGCAAVVAE